MRKLHHFPFIGVCFMVVTLLAENVETGDDIKSCSLPRTMDDQQLQNAAF